MAAATISNFGSMLTRIALPFVAVDSLRAAAADMSALNAARLVPALTIGLFLSAWIERRRKRAVMIGADLAHAALLAAVPLAVALGALSLPLLWAFAFLSGTLSLAFHVARQSFVPALASRERLVAANARIAAGSNAAETFAFGGGGWLVQLLSAPLALLADAASYLASAALLAGVREAKEQAAARSRERGFSRVLLGARAIAADARLRPLALVTLAAALASEALGVVYFLFVRRELGFSPSVLGMLFAAGSLAAFGASLAAPRLGRAFGQHGAIGVGLLVGALATGALALAPGATLLGGALILVQQLGDGGLTVFEIHTLSARQDATAQELQSRVHGALAFLGGVAMLAGAALGGLLGETIGPRATIAAAGAFLALVALGWLAAHRER